METIKTYEKDGEQWETLTIELPTKQADQVRRMSFKTWTSTNNIIRLSLKQFVEPEVRKLDYN